MRFLPNICCLLLILNSVAWSQTPPPRITIDPELDIYIDGITFFNLGRCPQEAEVKKAYREAAKIHHPDKQGDPDFMILLNQYYERLMAYFKVHRPPPITALTFQEPPLASREPPIAPPTHEETEDEADEDTDILQEVLESHMPQPPIDTPPPAPPPPPPSLTEESILFDPYETTYAEIYKLLNYGYHLTVCKERTAEEAVLFEKNYALGVATLAKYIHAIIGAFTRINKYPTRLQRFNLVQSLINNPFPFTVTVTNMLSICGSISYEGVINSCFDQNVVANIYLKE